MSKTIAKEFKSFTYGISNTGRNSYLLKYLHRGDPVEVLGKSPTISYNKEPDKSIIEKGEKILKVVVGPNCSPTAMFYKFKEISDSEKSEMLAEFSRKNSD